MSYPQELQALSNRFGVFIRKLEAKAEELREEAAANAQLIYDEDDSYHKRDYQQFKAGIEGQFKIIREKAYQVFETQIFPYRQSNSYDISMVSDWYSELYNLKEAFEDKMYQMVDSIFDQVKKISAETQLQEIWEEYEEVKNKFHCSQCGANLEVDQVYFVSTYITCPYCQTQNTFVPGTRMQMLQHLSREVAEERLQPLVKKHEAALQQGIDKIQEQLNYTYYRAMVWVERSHIVPVFVDEYAKVFMRELTESLTSYAIAPLKGNPELYKAQLEQMGFVKEMKPKVIDAYNAGDGELLRRTLQNWVMLYQLSAKTITEIYQGKAYEDLHNMHFQRVQNEWNFLTEVMNALKNEEISDKTAIEKIENQF